MIDPALKSSLLNVFAGLIPDRETAERFARYVDDMWDRCIETRAFGYSAHYQAVVGAMPRIFRMIRPLVTKEEQAKRLFSAAPNLLKWIPHTSEEDYWGYTHHLLLGPLRDRVERSQSLDDFIAGFERPDLVTVCPACGRDMRVRKSRRGIRLTCTCGASASC